jgi:hypothetical protein
VGEQQDLYNIFFFFFFYIFFTLILSFSFPFSSLILLFHSHNQRKIERKSKEEEEEEEERERDGFNKNGNNVGGLFAVLTMMVKMNMESLNFHLIFYCWKSIYYYNFKLNEKDIRYYSVNSKLEKINFFFILHSFHIFEKILLFPSTHEIPLCLIISYKHNPILKIQKLQIQQKYLV